MTSYIAKAVAGYWKQERALPVDKALETYQAMLETFSVYEKLRLHGFALDSMAALKNLMAEAGAPAEHVADVEAWMKAVARMVEPQDSPRTFKAEVPSHEKSEALVQDLKDKVTARVGGRFMSFATNPVSHLLGVVEAYRQSEYPHKFEVETPLNGGGDMLLKTMYAQETSARNKTPTLYDGDETLRTLRFARDKEDETVLSM